MEPGRDPTSLSGNRLGIELKLRRQGKQPRLSNKSQGRSCDPPLQKEEAVIKSRIGTVASSIPSHECTHVSMLLRYQAQKPLERPTSLSSHPLPLRPPSVCLDLAHGHSQPPSHLTHIKHAFLIEALLKRAKEAGKGGKSKKNETR